MQLYRNRLKRKIDNKEDYIDQQWDNLKKNTTNAISIDTNKERHLKYLKKNKKAGLSTKQSEIGSMQE